MKGQVSTELLVIIALVLLIFIPLLVLVYMKANDANQQIASYQAELAVSRIASLANSVGSLGTNTSVITDVYVPPNTVSLNTTAAGSGSEISLTLDTPQGNSEVVGIIQYPMVSYAPLADATSSGAWIKVNISSQYNSGTAMINIVRD